MAMYKMYRQVVRIFVHILLKKCLTFALGDGKIFYIRKTVTKTVLYREILVSGVFLEAFFLLRGSLWG